MLRAMKEQMVFLAKDDQGRFHEALKQRLGENATAELESRLKQMILRMPDLISRIHYFWSVSAVDSKIKVIGGYILMNLYSPTNLVSKGEWKLFGYLDDAYLVAKFFTTVIDCMEDQRLVTQEDRKLYEEAKSLKIFAREVIPAESAKTDRLIQGLLAGHDDFHHDLIRPVLLK